MCKVIWVEALGRVEILLLKSWDDAMGWVGVFKLKNRIGRVRTRLQKYKVSRWVDVCVYVD